MAVEFSVVVVRLHVHQWVFTNYWTSTSI